MKSFFQKVGILTKDEDTPGVTPKVEEVQEKPVTRVSLVSATLETSTVPTAIPSADPGLIEQYKTSFSAAVEADTRLETLFKYLESAAKLSRIADVKTRYQTALDITGFEPAAVLQNVAQYPQVLKELTSGSLSFLAQETEPVLEEHQRVHAALTEEKIDLTKRLNDIQIQLEDNYKAEQAARSTQMATEEAINKASEELNKEFNALGAVLTSTLQ